MSIPLPPDAQFPQPDTPLPLPPPSTPQQVFDDESRPGSRPPISKPPDSPSAYATRTPGQLHAQQPVPHSHSHGSSEGEGPDVEEIEMEPLHPVGHRRRRSSLITAGRASSSSRRSPRPRAHSIRNQIVDGPDGPKILEETGEGSLVAVRPDTPGDGHGSDLSDEDLHDDEETGLTRKDRQRKRRRRSRNRLLDQRIVREKALPQDKKEADRSVMKKLLVNASLIGLWYFFSLCISLYNKWMFDPKKLNFPFPLFTTSMHMLVQFSLALLVLIFVPSLRPQNGHRSDRGQSRHELEPEKPPMTKMFYLTRIGPCGVATGLDIGLGNTSLQFITLTFYTMCKSSSLAFVLIFAFLFHLEVPTWRLVTVIATMTLGVIMMVAGEVQFDLGGFFLVISAAFFSGFRWGLTQILLLRNPATSNPFSSIFFLAPVMFLTLIAIAIPVEGVSKLIDGLRTISSEQGALMAPLIILFPGMIAFFMTASEFALLQRTSVVTLSIAGIFKEAVTISAAALVFGDTMTPINIVGLFVTIGAIGAYNYIKISKMRQEAQESKLRSLELDDDTTDSQTHGNSSSPSSSDADADVGGDDGEETGLLRRNSTELSEVLFSADGGDVIITPEPSPQLTEAQQRAAARED
ncbi:triose-phosphate transporter family-domain-containing protein [Lasiosphaeria ovina]|uniref:Triose-phosphate transporter family-domain-containing protein n=1 Tax=Lasiosphaeria ovina TaxID=92902 RepID=A0AAE0JVB8_9PEZI|nr:triose-phosphate transporter family-domain-containing protein [Lasiosphaeria ovina]